MEIKDTRIQKLMNVADIISLLNLSFGFLSIIMTFKGDYFLSALFMIFSLFFDSIDGWVARKLQKNNGLKFGENIDSLSDAVSFGVAPSVLFYKLGISTGEISEVILLVISLIMIICGILRLTRYNVISDKIDFKGFIGFPIPGISFILVVFYLSGLFNIYIASILMVIISLLMISNVKYPKFNNMPIIGLSAILIILMFLTKKNLIFGINIPGLILLIISLGYLLINLKISLE